MKIIIVGASKGIGSAIAQRSAAAGHEVLSLSRSTDPPLDLTWSQEQITETVRVQVSNGLDALVISGGMGAYLNPVAPEEKIEELLRTNFVGPVLVYQAALKSLIKSSGSVLFLSSTVSRRPGASGLSVYAATKGAIESYVVSEARRVARKGVRMNVLSPGWVESPMTDEIDPALKERIIKAIPLKRMGSPEEIAQVALDIIEGPEFLTGSIVEIGGGA